MKATKRSLPPTVPVLGAESPLNPSDLAAAPELALISTVEHVLELMTLALIAAHPDLVGEPPLWRPRDRNALLAHNLLRARTRFGLVAAGPSVRRTAAACLRLTLPIPAPRRHVHARAHRRHAGQAGQGTAGMTEESREREQERER
jgi:hypothetical protein